MIEWSDVQVGLTVGTWLSAAVVVVSLVKYFAGLALRLVS